MIYFISLAIVSIIFINHMMKFDFLIIGIAWILLFFLLSVRYTRKWADIPEKNYIRKLFFTALTFRIVWVLFSYIYYFIKTGLPFEFGSSDALAYHDAAIWMKEIGWSQTMDYLSTKSIADSGYPIYLTILYTIFGDSVLIVRILKAVLGAWSCVLLYKLASRNVGEEAGRMAGIFCCLMPNLIMYCGLHLKEIEMIFLTIAALERADNLLRTKVTFWKVLLVAALIISLFTFRTVLGVTVIFAIGTSLVFSSSTMMSSWNRVVLITWAIIAIMVMAGGTIANEAQSLWEHRSENQTAKRDWQVRKGVEWAKYATGTVMAPMMFVLPFPTMVDVDEQYNQQLIHAGNFVKNFMGIFVIIAVFDAILRRKNIFGSNLYEWIRQFGKISLARTTISTNHGSLWYIHIRQKLLQMGETMVLGGSSNGNWMGCIQIRFSRHFVSKKCVKLLMR